MHGQALIDLGAAGCPPTPALAAVWLFPINKEKTAMTNAPLQRWPVILALCLTAMVMDRRVAKAQAQDGRDLSIELIDPKVLRVCADPRNLPFSNEKGDGF